MKKKLLKDEYLSRKKYIQKKNIYISSDICSKTSLIDVETEYNILYSIF